MPKICLSSNNKEVHVYCKIPNHLKEATYVSSTYIKFCSPVNMKACYSVSYVRCPVRAAFERNKKEKEVIEKWHLETPTTDHELHIEMCYISRAYTLPRCFQCGMRSQCIIRPCAVRGQPTLKNTRWSKVTRSCPLRCLFHTYFTPFICPAIWHLAAACGRW